MKYMKSLIMTGTFLIAVATINIAGAQSASAACVDYQYSYSTTTKTCVKYIQILANEIYAKRSVGAYRAPLVVDGKYGSLTTSYITNIQAYSNVALRNPDGSQGQTIFLSKDGITGRQTWAVLCNYSHVFRSNPNYYVLSAAGCTKSDSTYTAFDYFYAVGMSSTPH